MPESPDLHPLFTQLQNRYPTSGLITELVQIHADRAIVRALVQLGNVTLATSMATATTVEQAEDQARLRVLAVLGIHSAATSTIAGTSFSGYGSRSQPLSELSANHDLLDRLNETDVQNPSVPTFSHFEAVPPDRARLSAESTLPMSHAIPETLPDITSAQPSIPTPPLTSTNFDSSFAAPETEPYSALSDAIRADAIKAELETFDVPDDPEDEPFEEIGFEEPDPLFIEPEEEGREENERPEDPPKAADIPKSSSKPRKSGASKEAQTEDTSSSPIAPRDLSSLISQIGVEIDRIGWSKRQGSTYLQKTYGKKTRSELTDEELEDFLSYLSTQPAAAS